MIMSRIILCAVLTFFYVSGIVKSENQRWLMLGDAFADEDLIPPGIELDTNKIYFPASTRVDYQFRAKVNKTITCVIAAALHTKGWVSVIEGGLYSSKVKVRYMTENGEPDEFFVLVQSAKRDPLTIDGDTIRNSRYGIVHGPVRNWSLGDVQQIMRNFN